MTPNYWKIVALALRANEAKRAVLDELRRNGLDPAREYRYDDATETIEVINGDADRVRER